jgi:dihydroorotate dehydrogenase
MINYVEVIKNLSIKGELCKVLRNVNKLYFNQKKIMQINEELKEYYNRKKLAEIKDVNHGIYQLLIWELFVLVYLKVYNIFDFLNINTASCPHVPVH